MKQKLMDTGSNLASRAEKQIKPNRWLTTTVWQKWQTFGHRVADFQARLLLTLLYLLFIAPVGCFWRLVEDPLQRQRVQEEGSYWHQRIPEQTDLRHAGRQG
ncbi:MAG: hypothetical protein R3E79_44005 [Caldilineaceae bacterium]